MVDRRQNSDARRSRFPVADTAYGSRSLFGADSVPSLVVESDRQIKRWPPCARSAVVRGNGVNVCWLIDPVSRQVEVFEGDRDGVRLPADGILETPVMPGFSLPLSDLFAVLDR